MAGTLFENNLSPYLTIVEGSAPAAPTAGNLRAYIDSADHLLKWKDSGSVIRYPLVLAANRQQDLSTLPWWAINSDLVTTNAANRAAFYPFIPLRTITVTTFNFYVAAQSGNLDFGIYDASLTKLKSVGSTACPAIGIRTLAISGAGSQALAAGSLYYLAWWADNTTLKLRGWASSSAVAAGMTASATLGVCAYLNSAGTSLPAGPVTPSGYDLAFTPFVSLT